MTVKCAPPPPIASETMLPLLATTTAFAAAKPWEYMCDGDVVGLTDPKTGAARLVTVLGNGNEVFGVVFYRNPSGLRWLLNTLNDPGEGPNLEHFDSMDSVKVELVLKHELSKHELNALKTLNFRAIVR